MKRLPLLGIPVAVGALLLAGGVAYATIPDATNVIHGCYASKGGELRVIDTAAGQGCDVKRETPLDWNQTGLQGPEGPQGAAGPAGPAGISGLETASRTIQVPAGSLTTASQSCPTGKSPISGGWNAANAAAGFDVDESHAFGSDWLFTFYNGTGVAQSVTLDAVCVTVSS